MSKFLYNSEGYANISGIIDRGNVFNVVFGGRGTGKTYNAIKTAYERGYTVLWIRRGADEAKVCASEASCPWKAYMRDIQREYRVFGGKGLSEVHEGYLDDTEKFCPTRRLGYIGSLSNFSTVRGFDMSDVDVIFFDEFVPETSSHVKIKNEFVALLNLYESVNRNRELNNGHPCILVMMANQNTQASAIVAGLKLDTTVEHMEDTGTDCVENPRLSLGVYRLHNSPISDKKRSTALYKLAEGVGADGFTTMALDNKFMVRDDLARAVNLNKYTLIAVIGECRVYVPITIKNSVQFHIVRAEYREFKDRECYPATKQGFALAFGTYGKILADAYKGGRMTYDSLQTVAYLFDSMGVNVF